MDTDKFMLIINLKRKPKYQRQFGYLRKNNGNCCKGEIKKKIYYQ